MNTRIAIVAALLTIAAATALAFAQDATVAVTAPEINPSLSVYEQARAVIVDAVLALGAIAIGFIYMQVRKLIGEKIANQVRIYMDKVFRNVVVTQLGRTEHAETALTNATVKNDVIDKSANAIIAKIPDALSQFDMGLTPDSKPLRDKVEAEITKVLLETDPQKTLEKPDPLDAAYVPPKPKKD
jgi:hypothetical protein